ncbi:hypothetical protein ABZT17_28995, partial [Streptomyces sp. NPDC005648]
ALDDADTTSGQSRVHPEYAHRAPPSISPSLTRPAAEEPDDRDSRSGRDRSDGGDGPDGRDGQDTAVPVAAATLAARLRAAQAPVLTPAESALLEQWLDKLSAG